VTLNGVYSPVVGSWSHCVPGQTCTADNPLKVAFCVGGFQLYYGDNLADIALLDNSLDICPENYFIRCFVLLTKKKKKGQSYSHANVHTRKT